MRKGFNPNKDQKLEPTEFSHQVIIPVYIPNFEGYFKDSFEILKISLNSLFKTIHDKTCITIVNSGSHFQIKDYLNDLFDQGKIQEVIHTTNVGKLNAVLKAVVGNRFPLITISDADVLFLDGWQKASYDVFNHFPKCGFVSPCPSSKVLKSNTYNILLENLFSNKMKFTNVKNTEGLKNFAKSIGNPDFYNQYHLEKYLTIENDNFRAVIGGGHFVGTYRGDIFDELPYTFSEYSLGGISEKDLLDNPVVELGYWRLSTADNYVYHLGNVKEEWMEGNNQKVREEELKLSKLNKVETSKISNWLKSQLFYLFLSRKVVWSKFLLYKGLNKNAIKEY